MFALLMFNRFAIYSTRQNAERAAAKYIVHHVREMFNDVPSALNEKWQQENYAEVISIWNKYIAQNPLLSSSRFLYQTTIHSLPVDAPFA